LAAINQQPPFTRRTVDLICGAVATLIVERNSITLRLSSPTDGIERVYPFTISEWSRLIAPEPKQAQASAGA
jgi:hypothetical protein